MGDASFGPMWPNCNRDRIITITRHDGLRLPIHRDLADLVTLLMGLTELAGYDIKPGETWGYACRPIANTSIPSNHSQGTAVDINAPSNPRRPRGLPMITNIPRKVVDLWKGHGFRWGGDFSWPDPMHFEFMGTVTQAHIITARLRAFLTPTSPPPAPSTKPTPPATYPGTVRLGDEGAGVRVWQSLLRQRGYSLAADGVFGPLTQRAVMDWQRTHGLTVDGVAGEHTYHSVLFA